MASRSIAYVVEELQDVVLDVSRDDGLFSGHDLMSPYVWREGDTLRMLVRVLRNPLGSQDPTGVIYAGRSSDGVNFTMDPDPAITPGPDFFDAGGVEDPTVVTAPDGTVYVFYTGVDGNRAQGSLRLAQGPSLQQLTKSAVVLKAPEGEGNIKEATLARGADGRWRLFYEYAKDDASRIGLAVADSIEGPWHPVADPFTVRPASWDAFHLSTGPIVSDDPERPVMFYNGATADARWRIGWIAFDANFERVIDRGVEPMLVPPPPQQRSGTDIAFAASCLVENECIWLYYSIEDRVLRRAAVRHLS
ncbi:glycoside hydrolase family 130 protein [Novosphingobium aquimarinum]|uniref:glycoside hydrolase family 130 protein n=1 Tax=Novosphingobium aquimarinum TaxID=2682494 RepID=UPI001E36B279|nr:glycosidase [Novosphingobium aquimarinum]